MGEHPNGQLMGTEWSFGGEAAGIISRLRIVIGGWGTVAIRGHFRDEALWKWNETHAGWIFSL